MGESSIQQSLSMIRNIRKCLILASRRSILLPIWNAHSAWRRWLPSAILETICNPSACCRALKIWNIFDGKHFNFMRECLLILLTVLWFFLTTCKFHYFVRKSNKWEWFWSIFSFLIIFSVSYTGVVIVTVVKMLPLTQFIIPLSRTCEVPDHLIRVGHKLRASW